MGNADDLVNKLIKLLDKKQLLFDEIVGTTLEQKKDIEENDANGLESLIDRKQTLINSIDEIDTAFSQGFIELKKHLNVNDLEELDFSKYPSLKGLKQKVAAIMEVAKSIMEIEEYNKTILAAKMDEIKKNMKQLSVGKKTLKAYQNPTINNDGIYIDKKK